MIILISSLVSLAIVVAAVYYKESIMYMLLLFPVLFGYLLLGNVVVVDSEISHHIVTPICSKELGVCRLLVGKEVYEVDDYSVVNFFVNNLRAEMCTFYNYKNSYGITITLKVKLPNNIVHTLKTSQ